MVMESGATSCLPQMLMFTQHSGAATMAREFAKIFQHFACSNIAYGAIQSYHEELGILGCILQDWNLKVSRIRAKIEGIKRLSSMRKKSDLAIEFAVE
jgi:hypothetical protein